MFDTSFLLTVKQLIVNVFLPLIPGILFLILLFWEKIKGAKLYIIGWFLGAGLISHWMFNLQFIHFGVGIGEYCVLIGILIIALLLKIWKQGNIQWKEILWLQSNQNILNARRSASKTEKILSSFAGIFVVWFLVNSFVHTIQFPTYADDSFGNWHKPAINTYYDGGVKIFGEEEEILARGRLGYPIHVPLYKATVSHFLWGRHDIGINLYQWIGLFLILIFSFIITFEKTRNILYSILPSALIVGLPLVFRHSIDGYHELLSVYYSILAIRYLYEYLESKDLSFVVLASYFLWILSYIKNDGFVIYMPAVLISFGIVLLVQNKILTFIKDCRKDKKIFWSLLAGIIWFLLPFLALKQYYNLGFNQAQGESSGLGISNSIHREIFSVFKTLFFTENNYNLILIFVILILFAFTRKSEIKIKSSVSLLVLVPIVLFILFTMVFLFTDNFTFVMNQTTVNRTYTACFIILLFFISLVVYPNATTSQNTEQQKTSKKVN